MRKLNLAGLLMLIGSYAAQAEPVAQSGAVPLKTASDAGVVRLADACNRACRRGPVEEWGGKVQWHKHVGPACRPVHCTPR